MPKLISNLLPKLWQFVVKIQNGGLLKKKQQKTKHFKTYVYMNFFITLI